jgi:23S rRNA (cytosine1962-C5)-methyltransferase
MTDPNRSFIVYSDESWLVVDKPYGMATHGGDAGEVGVQEWLELHLDLRLYVCSRLDKGTTGLLLFARTKTASALAEEIHVAETSEKTYFFLATQDVRSEKSASWVCDSPLDGKKAFTKFWFEREVSPGHFLYKAVITRGRMHQIRRHASFSGCPLLGDTEYGGSSAPRIALHCAKLSWPGIEVTCESALPLSFSSETQSEGLSSIELAVALERRGSWLKAVTDAWRVVQRGEVSEFDLSVDVYSSYALVWIYDESDRIRLENCLQRFFVCLSKYVSLHGVVYRRVSKNPHKKGLVCEEWTRGEVPPLNLHVTEHGWKVGVALSGRQHVGHFLDHRDNRRRIELQAAGKRIANLFSYSCGYAVAAAVAGAEVVVNVDASASALTLGKNNFALNQLTESGVGKFVERDVRQWLQKQREKIIRGEDSGWDIIICDPPTFSSTKSGGAFQVRDEWDELVADCATILKGDGLCFLSNNCQAEERKHFEKAMRVHFSSVQRLQAPFDFPKVANRSHSVFYLCKK